MEKQSNTKKNKASLNKKIIGLGKRSIRKSCYSTPQEQLKYFEDAKKQLEESENKFRALFENMADGVLVANIVTKKFKLGNNMICKMLGYKQKEIMKLGIIDIHPREDLPHVIEQFERIARKEISMPTNIPVKRKDGSIFYADINATLLILSGKEYLMGVFRDITDHKQAEKALKEREKELEVEAHNLEEANIALKVLLKRRDEDKAELEEKVLLNINELVAPYLEKLKMSELDEKQKIYVSILESNLNELISPFSHKLSSKFLNFTSTEIQIANLLKQNKTSKEISKVLDSSPRAVAFHRDNIRKKLGLKNKKTNLKSFLLSI